jgi:Flp pilus assembly protein CpaB
VKKKSPPYAIIVAAIIGFVGIFLLWKWKQQMDLSSDAKVNAATQQLQAEIDQLKAQTPVQVAATPTNMRKVYYATQPVEAGAKISPAFYEEKLTPNDVLPDAYGDGSDVVGFFAIRPIEKGDPLTPRNIGKTLPYLSERIPAGMRALALPIFNADVNDTGGFVVDGDKVDLLFTTLGADGATAASTQTVLQSVEVLFVPGPQTRSETTAGITPAPTPGEPLSVTFMVTPEQAQALVYLTQDKFGHFSMVLRGRTDVAEFAPKPFDGDDYLDNLKKVQRTVDRSYLRVKELQDKIQAEEQKEKDQAASGKSNETTRPSPPSP